MKSVRAGDLFLSQSSKWLHFGKGGTFATVTWPGGKREVFEGLSAGGRYLFKQGTGDAKATPPRNKISIALSKLPSEIHTKSARIVLPALAPMPTIRFRDKSAQKQTLEKTGNGQSRLLVIWSADCEHCVKLLASLPENSLALAVDRFESGGFGKAFAVMDEIQPSFEWGLIESDSLIEIDRFQKALFDGPPPLSVPLSFLLNEKDQAVAIFRGDIDNQDENKKLLSISPLERHHLATPIPGKWFTNPVDPRWFEAILKSK